MAYVTDPMTGKRTFVPDYALTEQQRAEPPEPQEEPASSVGQSLSASLNPNSVVRITDRATGQVYTRPAGIRFSGYMPGDLPSNKWLVEDMTQSEQPPIAPQAQPAQRPTQVDRFVTDIVNRATTAPTPQPQAPVAPQSQPDQPAAPEQVDGAEMFEQSSLVPVTTTETQTTITPGFKPSKAALKTIEAANAAKANALATQSALEREKAEFAAFDTMQKRVAVEDQNAREESKQTIEDEQMQGQMNKIAEATALNDDWKLDPDRLLNRNAWAGIAAAVSIGLGAAASSFGGGPNYALQIINSAIDRDIDAQKAEYTKNKGKAEELRSNYALMRQKIGDDRTAREGARLRALQAVDASLAERQAKFAGKAAEAKIAEMRAGLDGEIADQKLKLEQLAQNKVQTVIQSKTSTIDTSKLSKDQLETANVYRKEYSEKTKDDKETLKQSRLFKEHIKGAREGNSESIASLNYLLARQLSGPGVLTDNDLKNASVNRGMLEGIQSKLVKGFGGITDREIASFERVAKAMERVSNKNIGVAAKDYMQLSKRTGIPGDIVVLNDDDRNLGLNSGKKEQPPASAAAAAGMKKVR